MRYHPPGSRRLPLNDNGDSPTLSGIQSVGLFDSRFTARASALSADFGAVQTMGTLATLCSSR